jgi:hypothetical protein
MAKKSASKKKAAASKEKEITEVADIKGKDEGALDTGGVQSGAGLSQTAPVLMNADNPLAREQQLTGGSPGTRAKTAQAMETRAEGLPEQKSFKLKSGMLVRLPSSLRGSAPMIRLKGDVEVESLGAPFTEQSFLGLFTENDENWNLVASDYPDYNRVTGRKDEEAAA